MLQEITHVLFVGLTKYRRLRHPLFKSQSWKKLDFLVKQQQLPTCPAKLDSFSLSNPILLKLEQGSGVAPVSALSFCRASRHLKCQSCHTLWYPLAYRRKYTKESSTLILKFLANLPINLFSSQNYLWYGTYNLQAYMVC